MRVANVELERRTDQFEELHQEDQSPRVFGQARWVWCDSSRSNLYAAFATSVSLEQPTDTLEVTISASYHYEIYIGGQFVNRGPIHGDPKWCHYDDLRVTIDEPTDRIEVLILVHHPSGTHIHCLTPAPGGLICRVRAGSTEFGTDESWRCSVLPMWNEDVKQRNWALGYCEDYDARLEPDGWQERIVKDVDEWKPAMVVFDADTIWGAYQPRITPLLERRPIEPRSFSAFRARGDGAVDAFDVSEFCDTETLEPVAQDTPFSIDSLNASLERANAFTLDLGAEYIGFYSFDIEAAAGTLVEISGAELLQPDTSRPWIYRKGTCYSVRYRCRDGRNRYTSFLWSGFRYLHIVIRPAESQPNSNDAAAPGVTIGGVCAVERSPGLTPARDLSTGDARLDAVVSLCERTLRVAPQEHLVDCPTREQSPAFADGLIVAAALLEGFDEASYLLWYLEALLHAPLNEHHQFCGRYPSTLGYWLDFCLFAFQHQKYYRRRAGRYYKPVETLARGLELKKWFDGERNDAGVIDFPFEEYFKRDLRNFVDHPGLGMHDSPHPGIDRDGASAGLNIHFYAFLSILAAIAAEAGDGPTSDALERQATELRAAIRDAFFDGKVFHDARKDGHLSPFTSWQTNSMAVFFDIAEPSEYAAIMQAMLDGYNELCRCTPFSHYFFLPALEKAGLAKEARELIKREWGRMIDGGATTTWEGFEGDAKDSLCHPWAVTPYLYLAER